MFGDESAIDRERCGHCGADDPLFPVDGVPICHSCLAARLRSRVGGRENWLTGTQLRAVDQLAAAGEPISADTARALIADVRRLRRCTFQIQERILALDETPGSWSEVRQLGPLVATILSLINEVDPHA